jgi:hypothetical protein
LVMEGQPLHRKRRFFAHDMHLTTPSRARHVHPGGRRLLRTRAEGLFCYHPCPCGWYGDPVKECTCSHAMVSRYQKRISGPLLDRIDIHSEVPHVENEKLSNDGLGESSGAHFSEPLRSSIRPFIPPLQPSPKTEPRWVFCWHFASMKCPEKGSSLWCLRSSTFVADSSWAGSARVQSQASAKAREGVHRRWVAVGHG